MLSFMDLESLAALLQRRLQIIADHDLRSQNPQEQLRQLQEVSESIASAHEALRRSLDPRLNHFMTQASYDKALAYIKDQIRSHEG